MENKMSEFADTKVIKNLIEQYNNNDINTLMLLRKVKKFKLFTSNNTDTVKKNSILCRRNFWW